MSYILHIDTSAETSEVSIAENGVILAEIVNSEVRNHAQAINNMIESALTEAGIAIKQLNAIAVCSGPGSYTGLRIAMATAKGICYASDIPLISTDKLTLLANIIVQNPPIDGLEEIVPILTAREGEYFLGVYTNNGICSKKPAHVLENQVIEILNDIKNPYIISDTTEELFYKLKVNLLGRSADIKINHSCWAVMAYNDFNSNRFVNLSLVTPEYLKQVYTHK